MICPYCGKEMIEGYVSTNTYEIKFFPKSDKDIINDNLCRGVIKPHILLTKGNFLFTGKLESFYCSNCKVMISPVVDFNENKK